MRNILNENKQKYERNKLLTHFLWAQYNYTLLLDAHHVLNNLLRVNNFDGYLFGNFPSL